MGVKASAQITVYIPYRVQNLRNPLLILRRRLEVQQNLLMLLEVRKAYISWIALYFAMMHFSILEFLCLQVTKRQRIHTAKLSMWKAELKRIEKGKDLNNA